MVEYVDPRIPQLLGSPYAQEQTLGPLFTRAGQGEDITEALQSLLRQIGISQVPSRLAGIQEAINAAQRLAGGSPQEVLTQFNQQINQIQQQLQQQSQTIARQGGYGAGGQARRGQTQALAQAAAQLQQIYGGAQTTGRANLQAFAGGISPVVGSNIPVAREGIQRNPFDFGAAGGSLGSTAGNLQQLLAGLVNRTPPPPALGAQPTIQQPLAVQPSTLAFPAPPPVFSYAPPPTATAAPGTTAYGF